MAILSLKPTDRKLTAYYESVAAFDRLGVKHETAVRSAFQVLLDDCGRQFGWKLIPEYPIRRKGLKPLRADGALVDAFNLPHGLWEAKDTTDDLEKEIKAKLALGYPRENLLFQSPRRVVLYQGGQRVFDTALEKPEHLIDSLRLFLEFEPPAFAEWEKASDEFKSRIPEYGEALRQIIATERKTNKAFVAAFADFLTLCRASLNPNLSEAAVEEMLIQHILTERIFRKIFAVADFMQRNVIAVEIEKVIGTLASRHFTRDDFLKKLDRFYVAIEHAAATIYDFSEKQKFLNTVYERFFQGFSVKVADTHGIVYTPQPLVDFMITSVDRLLSTEFIKDGLAAHEVHVLDGFVGTGNFIVNLMRGLPRTALQHKYAHELHCNEVMLLPYYIASMNIEHEYFDAIGSYAPFEGICLVDTFQIAEEHTGGGVQSGFEFFSKANTERIKRQRKTPIFVCLGNPPYNAGQVNENDNNKNRKYPELDRRVSRTYGEASRATLVRKLADPYVKAIRWATDRIGEAGIVAFVNNNSFVDEISFDGMRKHLAEDFDLIYVLNLGGNVRKNPKLSGTTHNVFGIQVGVSINFFVRLQTTKKGTRKAKILYHAVPIDWRKEEKYQFLIKAGSIAGMKWEKLKPDGKNTWLTSSSDAEFTEFLPLGLKEAKADAGSNLPVIFRTYSLGVSTNRDSIVYDFDKERLAKCVETFCDEYNAELHRWKKKGCPSDIDSFVNYEKVKWSRNLKRWFKRATELKYNADAFRRALYRPFTSRTLYFARIAIDEIGDVPEFLPNNKAERENRVICVSDVGLRANFSVLATNRPFDLHLCASTDAFQGFPFYTYDGNGKNRRENIPLSTLVRFQNHYDDEKITKWDIFQYVYAVLHHSEYRQRFAVNFKRELPRIPMLGAAKEFRALAEAGQRLIDLHVDYESAKEFPLKRIENREVPLSWRVERMKLTPDKTAIVYNEFLTLAGVPPEALSYRLGNRSAVEWIIDQYQVFTDARSGIESDPNRLEDEQYIVRLIAKVITVSLETQKIIAALSKLSFPSNP